jgi:thiol-disulfide isomerase/thioredoxin
MIELTQKDFILSGKKLKVNNKLFKQMGGMVVFKADWCGHCRRLLPELEEVSSNTGRLYPIVIVDADKNPQIIQKANIQGFPTVKFVDKHGYIKSDYSGGRTASDILEAICSNNGSKGAFCKY